MVGSRWTGNTGWCRQTLRISTQPSNKPATTVGTLASNTCTPFDQFDEQPESTTHWNSLENGYAEHLQATGARMPGGPTFTGLCPELHARKTTAARRYSIPQTGNYESGLENFFDGYILKESLNAIDHRDPSKPFLLNAMFIAPHPPFDIPSPWYEKHKDVPMPENVGRWDKLQSPLNLYHMAGALGARYQRDEWQEPWRVYAGLVSLLDHCVGQIIDKLKEQGMYEDSVILFTADHGEMLGSHCLWQKMVLYEESALTPLSIRLPGGKHAGVANAAPSSHLDVFPTLCDLAGIEIPDTVSGCSLRPEIEGGAPAGNRPVFVQSDGNGSLEKWSRGVIIGEEKLIVDGFKDEVFFELYDLAADPFEADNRAFEDPDIVLRLLAKLSQHMRATGDAVHLAEEDYTLFKRTTPTRPQQRSDSNPLMKALLTLALIPLAGTVTALAKPTAHPSFFFTLDDVPAMQERAESTEWLRTMKQAVIDQADYFLETETDPYPLSGPDNGIGTAGRFVQKRLGILALAGYLTGELSYFEKGTEILLAIVRQCEADNTDHWRTHLQYADATQGLALGYDLLYPYLTDAERGEVRAELYEYGHLLYTDGSAWGCPSPGVTSCNHNAVQFGALGLAALALGDQPDWVARATDRVRGFYKYFVDPTGYVTEGHHYLSYGQLGAFPFSMALKRSGGPDLVAEQPLTSKIVDQFVWVLLPFGNKIRTLNDNDPQPIGPVTMAHALRNRDPVHLWAWWQAIGPEGSLQNGLGLQNDGFGELFPFIIGDEPLEPVSPGEADWPLGKRYDSGRVFLRSAWDNPDAAHVVFKSGYDMHQGHNQQDENSIAFAALGEDFLTDPGYWPDGSDCHTTLKINGVEQQIGSIGRVVDYREDAHGAFVRGQAPEAYPLVPGFIGHAERKLYFVRSPQPYIVWRDDVGIEVGHKPTEVVSRYITTLDNTIKPHGDGAIIEGGHGRASCLVLAFSEGKPIKVSEDDLADQSYTANAHQKVVYTEHFKRLSATANALHPRLLSIALPFHEESELPKVEVSFEKSTDTLTCQLTFKDGHIDTIIFDSTNAVFHRSK